MIEAWVGEEEFRTGVNAYIDRFKYGNARAEDFWATMAKSTGKPVDRVMKAFVDQPGVPLVDAALGCAGARGTATIAQQRPAASGAAGRPVWAIPVCVKTPVGRVTCEVVGANPAALPLDLCPGWVMANAGARGYYRTVYTPEILRRMAKEVGALAPAERIGLLSDEWALVRAGRHDVGLFLDLASGFTAERTAAVVSTLAGALAAIGDDLTTDGSRAKYRAWLSALLRPALGDVGWSPSPEETDDTRALRATLVTALGDAARDPDVLARAGAVVLDELAKPGRVEPTLLDAAVRVAAKSGDAALYDRYLARGKGAADPDDRYRFLYGLTSFNDPSLVRRTIDYILGPDVRNQDTAGLMAALLGNRDAHGLAWQILQARWDDLQKKTSGFAGHTVVVAALASFCDAGTLAGVKAFFAARRMPEAERSLQQATERIQACSNLAAAQSGKLEGWLRNAIPNP
jgi:aminopeptidase N